MWKLTYKMLLIWYAVLSLITMTSSSAIEVRTALGDIRGVVLKSRSGVDFNAFRGIRYAESPVGELRFKDPVPINAWKPKVFDATEDGPVCPQVWDEIKDLSEDCLRLNVYTKDLNGTKPVIVYLHPGGFYSVTGQSKITGPQYLMDRDVVLVTMNYRLGTLGFLATGTKDAPGNAGLKDQIVALRWIQAHIKNFGGNPNSVTLLGYSAGSLSIGLHMLSPMGKGLFHRGIAMSASPLAQFEYCKDGLYLAKRQAELLNCPTEPTNEIVKCLKEKSMLDFVETQPAMFEFGWHPIFNWMPVIEDDFGQERYLIEDPYKTILGGKFHKVPLITGITEYEFTSAAYYVLINDTQRDWFNNEFEKYAPIAFLYERDTPRSRQISQRLRSEYLKNKTLEMPNSLKPFGELFSDAVIGFEYHRFLDLVSRHIPVYTYLFKYKGRFSHFTYPGNQTYGAVHHDELLYLFYVPFLTPFFKETDPENKIIERLTRMWTEFAHKGDPNNHGDEYLKDIHWKLYTKGEKEYLDIDENVVSKTGGIFEERFKIWDELFPIPQYATFL